MIQIRCCSKDELLMDRLRELYGSTNVTRMADAAFLLKGRLRDSEVVIVDLKYNNLPSDTNFTSPIIVLTAVPSFSEAFRILQLGIRGYGNRLMRPTNLKQVIENVKDGQIWLPPSIISQLIDVVGQKENSGNAKPNNVLSSLSKREKEVALFVAKGMSNQEVADQMFVSLRTIKAHLTSIYEKTGLRSRLELGLALS